MEIVPGISARQPKTDEHEIAELKAKIAAEQISQEEERERKRKALLEEVRARIADEDGPIRITPEMEELGIAQDVWNMVQQAQLAMGFKHALNRDDDDDSPASWLD